MIRFAYNPTAQPVDLDDQGHQLAGRDWGPADDSTDQAKAAAARGALVWADPPNEDGLLNPHAKAGWDRYEDAVARHALDTGTAPDEDQDGGDAA